MRGRYLTLMAIAGALVVGAIGYWISLHVGQSERPVTAAAEDTMHVKVTIRPVGGSAASQQVHEFWIVSPTLKTRYVISQAGATNPSIVMVRDGTALTVYDWQTGQLTTSTARSSTDAMLDIANRFLAYKTSLDAGALTILETGTVQGLPAVRVQMEYPHDAKTLRLSVWLREDNKLPLSEITFDITTGTPIQIGVVNFIYDVVEYIDSTQLPAGFFTVAAPAAATPSLYSDQYMTLVQAQAFSEFTVYWLDDPFGGLPVNAFQLSSATSPSGAASPQFSIYYSRSFSEDLATPVGSIQIVQIPLSLYQTTEISGTTVQIKNTYVGPLSGTLYVDTLMLEIPIGATHVTIYGRSQQELLDAAAALRQLN